MSIESVVESAVASPCRHIVLTGGEPLLPLQSSLLAQSLREAGLHLTIETAGTVDRDVPCDLMSISPKFHSSAPDSATHPEWNRRHHLRRMPIDTIRALIDRAPDHQLKFVVDSPEDFDELQRVVDEIGSDPDAVWVMPQGTTLQAIDEAAAWLRPWCEARDFHYCDRMQIRWFGNRRGT